MDSDKQKDSLHAIETPNCCAASEFPQTDPTGSASPCKGKKTRRNVMELSGKKKRVSRKSKTRKSKDSQVCADDSKTVSAARKRTRACDLFDDIEAEFSVKERAQRVLDHLGYKLPHFVKCMLPSNVAHGFWLHLPKKFCTSHLPNHDTSITLVDEWGNEYSTSYLLDRYGLSAGWRNFSILHRLLKGDILIFHLIAPCMLKVHIVRVHDPDVISAALCLMDISASDPGKKENRKRKNRQYVEPFLLDCLEPLVNDKGKEVCTPAAEPDAHQSGDQHEGFSSEDVEGNGVRNPPKSNKKLCYSETSFLHDHSREGVTCM